MKARVCCAKRRKKWMRAGCRALPYSKRFVYETDNSDRIFCLNAGAYAALNIENGQIAVAQSGGSVIHDGKRRR
ncbi:MAG: hypothetical protein LBL45_13210 [Treponema sp.]|nr:hypothetical protein [Treponema sp.]